MLLAYERLDAMWRIRYGLSADEKLVVLFLAEHAVLIGDLEAAIGIPMPDGPGLLERLEVRGFLRSVHGDAVALTKKGLSARLEFERTTRRIAEAGIDADGNAEAHHRFLEIA
ncbi:MAG: hypothetical protein JWM98_3425, partial [Thermoleophilia bacterium]|nr:hypothetical protein [Thermoleophilia bacterium]